MTPPATEKKFPTHAELLGSMKMEMFVDAVILANCEEVVVVSREIIKLVNGKFIPVGRFAASCMLSSEKYGDRYMGYFTGETFSTEEAAIASQQLLIELAKADPELKTSAALKLMREKLVKLAKITQSDRQFTECIEMHPLSHA